MKNQWLEVRTRKKRAVAPHFPSEAESKSIPKMNQNLNQISRQMPFGHTDYVPPDETRNFKALVPLADEIKNRLDTQPSVVLKVDSEQYPPELVTKYETEIKEHPLPAPDYHKLLWGRRTSKYFELSSVYNGSLSPFSSPNKQRRSLTVVQRTRQREELNLPELESHYRSKSARPFQINHIACHLFDQPITLSHAKKLKLRLGHDMVMLNDPIFTESLCDQIRREIENNEEDLSRRREAKEVMRSAAAKKKSRYGVDEYFEAMHLPELCDQKPWLWKCKKNNRITAECEPEWVLISFPEHKFINCEHQHAWWQKRYLQWPQSRVVRWHQSQTCHRLLQKLLSKTRDVDLLVINKET